MQISRFVMPLIQYYLGYWIVTTQWQWYYHLNGTNKHLSCVIMSLQNVFVNVKMLSLKSKNKTVYFIIIMWKILKFWSHSNLIKFQPVCELEMLPMSSQWTWIIKQKYSKSSFHCTWKLLKVVRNVGKNHCCSLNTHHSRTRPCKNWENRKTCENN